MPSFSIRHLLLAALAIGGCTSPNAVPQELGGATLRDVYLGVENAELDSAVGRLGIVLVRGGRHEQVGLRHAFSTGDQFRFDISANRDGWLFILHTDPGGRMSQLWPPRDAPAYAIQAGSNYLIPANPNVFVFSDDSGEESFYVAIRTDPTPPALVPGQNPQPQPTGPAAAEAAQAGNRIVNFDVRDPFGDSSSALVFESQSSDTDRYLYFSALPEDDTTSASIAFQLQHGR